MDKKEIVDLLVSTMNLDYDAVQAYSRAIDNIQTEGIRQHLMLYRSDHERHIRELGEMISSYGGGEVEPNRDIRGVFLEGMTALQGQFGERAAIMACETGEKFVNNRYRSVVSRDLPTDVKDLVSRNYEDEKRHLKYIQSITAEWAETRHPVRNTAAIAGMALMAIWAWRRLRPSSRMTGRTEIPRDIARHMTRE